MLRIGIIYQVYSYFQLKLNENNTTLVSSPTISNNWLVYWINCNQYLVSVSGMAYWEWSGRGLCKNWFLGSFVCFRRNAICLLGSKSCPNS